MYPWRINKDIRLSKWQGGANFSDNHNVCQSPAWESRKKDNNYIVRACPGKLSIYKHEQCDVVLVSLSWSKLAAVVVTFSVSFVSGKRSRNIQDMIISQLQ